MTIRQEILDEYSVEPNGIISDPGKFKGQMLYAPYFSDNANDGEELSTMEDGCSEYVSLVAVNESDRIEFPEISTSTRCIGVIENDQGFVSCTELTEEEAERWIIEYALDNN